MEALSLTNPIFRSYVFWSTVMVLKMLAMASLTGIHRFKNKSFANPDDARTFWNDIIPKINDPDVERVRRAHRNDLENITAFITIAFFYVLTSPNAFLAINLFRASAISRIVHTVVYAIIPTQPARAVSWFVCYLSTIYMGLQVLFFFM